MHRNDICLGIIHADIIIISTVQPRLDVLLQAWSRFHKVLPLCHELLKYRNGTTHDWGFLAGHCMLDQVQTLLVQLHQDTYNHLLVTHTQNDLDI